MNGWTTEYRGGSFSATVTTDEPEGPAVLTWHDGVANRWTEQHNDASTAFARLALLVACESGEWSRGFTDTDPESFADAWRVTLRGMLTTPGVPSREHFRPVATALPSVDYLESVGYPWDGYTLVSWQDVAEHMRVRLSGLTDPTELRAYIDDAASRLVESHGATTMDDARAEITGLDNRA